MRKFRYRARNMKTPNAPLDPVKVQTQIQSGRFFHTRGWVPATAGNFSFRVNEKILAVTVSGRPEVLISSGGNFLF